jgi:hypothetical protein
MTEDPQIHSDTPLRTKRSLSELGRGYFTATEWEGHGVPGWLEASSRLLCFWCCCVLGSRNFGVSDEDF